MFFVIVSRLDFDPEPHCILSNIHDLSTLFCLECCYIRATGKRGNTETVMGVGTETGMEIT